MRFLGTFLIGVFLFVTFFAKTVLAEGEFGSSYNVKYEVDENGEVKVDEKVTLKNKTDKFFPSSFNLTISATDIRELTATDVDGELETKLENLGKKSQITVKFVKQIGGKGKEYSFDLKFASKDFAQKNGDVWQVSFPKIGSADAVDGYNLLLSVPVAFGEPAFITPQPKAEVENGGNLLFSFNKDQLATAGVLGFFGEQQLFDFALSYKLENDSILPQVQSIGLPSDSAYQHILLKSIDPQPDQVLIDGDGNYRAFYRLDRRGKKTVTVGGLARVSVSPEKGFNPLSPSQQAALTASQIYWDATNPQIKDKVKEILKDDTSTTTDKMLQLYRYVVSTLSFDYARLKENPTERLGALTALANPPKALSSEYTDLLIALARSAGIPARQVIGVAFSNSSDLRPISYLGNNLHAWVEYFDQKSGWKAVDPTWESTSGGVDYFSQSLINHLAVVKRGESSREPIVPSDAVITFTDQSFQVQKGVKVFLEAEQSLYSGFPQKANLKIENTGNVSFPKSTLTISSKRIQFVQSSQKGENQISVVVGEIPPFGNQVFPLELKTGNLTQEYDDFILVGFADQVYYKEVHVIPFYKSPIILFSAIGIFIVILALYIVVLGVHLRIGHEGIKLIQSKKK